MTDGKNTGGDFYEVHPTERQQRSGSYRLAPERRGNQQGGRAVHARLCGEPCMKIIAVNNKTCRQSADLRTCSEMCAFSTHLFCGDHSSPLYTHEVKNHLSGGDSLSPLFCSQTPQGRGTRPLFLFLNTATKNLSAGT
jgi:hypothetical protein